MNVSFLCAILLPCFLCCINIYSQNQDKLNTNSNLRTVWFKQINYKYLILQHYT